MSQISNSPRRPSTAQSTLTTRMPYEAGEALLWERQNNRVYAHLSVQMKELQAQHDAYDTRIQATESVAEAAEAAVHKLKQMEAKIVAMEADDRDRPFDAWAKEAISQLQVFVDGHKGVRQKLSGLEQRVEHLGDDVEGVKDEGGLLRSVVRRLEALEFERAEHGRELEGLRKEQQKLKTWNDREKLQNSVEIRSDGVQKDHDPIAVFYGVDKHAEKRQRKSNDGHHGDAHRSIHERTLSESSRRGREPTGNLQPADEGATLPEGIMDRREVMPKIDYSFENTQQFKDMQKELIALRAMCRTQESNQTMGATQHVQETIVIPRDDNMISSDATTETEAEGHLSRARKDAARESSSRILLPSSPPIPQDTQSARRNLMKRPSIYDPRVLTGKEGSPHAPQADDAKVKLAQDCRPSLMVKLPVITPLASDRAPRKRKREEHELTQRILRSKFSHEAGGGKESTSFVNQKGMLEDDLAFADCAPLPLEDDRSAPSSPMRKTFVKQPPAANYAAHQAIAQDTSSRRKQPAMSTGEPTASAAETAKLRYGPGKSKPNAQDTLHKQDSASATFQKLASTVKREDKEPRQRAGACKSCRLRHQKCDRAHPACGRCVKSGALCEYFQAHSAPSGVPPASSPRDKKSLHLNQNATKDISRKHGSRGKSTTVKREIPRQKDAARRRGPDPPLANSMVVAAPTAASTRALRAKKV